MGEGLLQSFNINELAGATGLMLGALGGLLAVIWKSRCHCKMNLCYLCQCERKPPPTKEVDSSDEEAIVPKEIVPEEIVPKDTTATPNPTPNQTPNQSPRSVVPEEERSLPQP